MSSPAEHKGGFIKRFGSMGVVLGLLIGVGFALKGCPDSHGRNSARNGSPGAASSLQASGTACAEFTERRATCPGAKGDDTGWLLVNQDAPAGLHMCWEPGSADSFQEVWYLDDARKEQPYDFAKPPGDEVHIGGWRFVFARPTTLTYGLQTTPCRTKAG